MKSILARVPWANSRIGAAVIALSALSWTASAKSVPHVATEGDFKGTDSFWTTAYITRDHGYMVYGTLFTLDENFKVRPRMVDTREVSEDARTDSLREVPTGQCSTKW